MDYATSCSHYRFPEEGTVIMKAVIITKDGRCPVNLNRRMAIHQRCLDCSGWQHVDVRGCTITDCSLYPFRTGKGEQNAKARAKALHDYCIECMNGQRHEVLKCPAKYCAIFVFRTGNIDDNDKSEILNEIGGSI